MKAIYFDAGTGRGIGVETRVTDSAGKSLLHEVIEQEHINQFGNFLIKDGTNNLGELLGLNIALLIAKKKNIKEIYGDSELVIKYWSKGRYNKLPERTIKRIKKVTELRKEFEANGGKILKYIWTENTTYTNNCNLIE